MLKISVSENFLVESEWCFTKEDMFRVFQQTVGIPMGTNCAPLLADFFLYSYGADFIQGLLKKNEKKLARSFNFTFPYIEIVNQKLEHVEDFSFRKLFGRIRVVFYKGRYVSS
jgi:hypothetical protein